MTNKIVAVIGASNKPDRYSYKAVVLLREKGYIPYPVNPRLSDLDGIAVHASIADIPAPIDTVTLYLSAENQRLMAEAILKSGARRVIFNPGAENPDLAQRLEHAGIEAINACTLVMLRTGQF